MLSNSFLVLWLLTYIISSSYANQMSTFPSVEDNESISDFAKFIKANLAQKNVSRCDDFYTYACGNWKENKMIPEEVREFSATHLAEYKFDKLIENFLNNNSKIDINTAEGKAKMFFSSCVNMSKEISLSMNPILSYIESKIPKNIDFNWIDINFLYEEYGVYPFLKLETTHNEENNRNEFSIKYPEHDWFLKIINFMQSVLTEDTEHGAKFFSNIPKAQEFFSQLNSLGENNNEPETSTLGEFISLHNNSEDINWTRFFDIALNGSSEYTNWKIHNYLKNSTQYNNFLRNSDTEILFYYDTMNLLSEYINMFKDQVQIEVRKSCIHLTKTHFRPALMPWLIERTGASEWREDVNKIISQIRDAFELRVKNNYWLDEATKAGAGSKLSAMQFIVGYTDDMMNRSLADNAYNSVNITENFWQNLLNLKKKEISDSRQKGITMLKQAFSKAIYFPNRNILSIPLQYTQIPFYNRSYSDLMKLGGLGFLIGYGMATGFNTDNYKFNDKGKEQNWWTEGALKNFTTRNECMKSQLSDLTYNNVKITDRITMAEIVANDLGGRIAQDAYFKLLKEQSNGDEKSHTGLDFTNKQLYFLQFAQSLCIGDVTYKFSKYWISQFHATEPFRVNGILRNKPEFSDVFQCPIGSNLNIVKKCP